MIVMWRASCMRLDTLHLLPSSTLVNGQVGTACACDKSVPGIVGMLFCD